MTARARVQGRQYDPRVSTRTRNEPRRPPFGFRLREKGQVMRVFNLSSVILSSLILLTACSDQEAKGDAVDFRPPTNQTRADFASTIGLRFHAMDGNRNGTIEPGELRPDRVDRVMAADANRDGHVALGEFETAQLARFDAADKDSDHILSSAERDAAGWGGRN
jgi:hypothetical protein